MESLNLVQIQGEAFCLGKAWIYVSHQAMGK